MTDTAIASKTKQKLAIPTMWRVKLHNDDFTPMDFVVGLLMTVFRKTLEESMAITMHVHNSGHAIVGVFTREVAETKVDQALAMAKDHGHPLLVTYEQV